MITGRPFQAALKELQDLLRLGVGGLAKHLDTDRFTIHRILKGRYKQIDEVLWEKIHNSLDLQRDRASGPRSQLEAAKPELIYNPFKERSRVFDAEFFRHVKQDPPLLYISNERLPYQLIPEQLLRPYIQGLFQPYSAQKVEKLAEFHLERGRQRLEHLLREHVDTTCWMLEEDFEATLRRIIQSVSCDEKRYAILFQHLYKCAEIGVKIVLCKRECLQDNVDLDYVKSAVLHLRLGKSTTVRECLNQCFEFSARDVSFHDEISKHLLDAARANTSKLTPVAMGNEVCRWERLARAFCKMV
jgi:hypothetical protein